MFGSKEVGLNSGRHLQLSFCRIDDLLIRHSVEQSSKDRCISQTISGLACTDSCLVRAGLWRETWCVGWPAEFLQPLAHFCYAGCFALISYGRWDDRFCRWLIGHRWWFTGDAVIRY